MQQADLTESATITLDGSGNGTLRMRPAGGGETWTAALVSVKCSTAVSEATCRLFAGPSASDIYYVAGTLSGSTGDSTDQLASYSIDTHGTSLWAVWSGGDPGTVATMIVSGTRTVP